MKLLGQRSIKTLFSLAFILQVLTPIGVISYLSWQNTENSVTQLGEQLMQRIGQRVLNYLDNSMSTAEVILQNSVDALDNQYIQTDDLSQWHRYFLEQIKQSPQIAYVYFGKPSGEYIEIAQGAFLQPTGFSYRVVPPQQIGTLTAYQLSPTGTIGPQTESYAYDPRQRPWYKTAQASGQPRWSEVYPFMDHPNVLGISLVKRYYNAQQQFQGVLGVDYTLLNLNQILQGFNHLPGSAIFITEPNGLLIANSLNETPYNDLRQRIQADQVQSPLIRAAAQKIAHDYRVTIDLPLNYNFQFAWNQQRYYGRLLRLQNPLGVNWLVVVVLPEQALMGQLGQQRQQTAILIAIAMAATFATSYILGRWVASPIVKLSRTSQRIAAGAFDGPIPVRSSREVNLLATEFQHMRDELQKNYQILEAQARSLEDRVQSRTLELQQEILARKATNQVLENTLTQLQTTQDQLVRSAKLAALGEMIAAVAHEMNRPLSTIQSMAKRLEGNIGEDFVHLPQLLQQLPESLQVLFFQLVQWAIAAPHHHPLTLEKIAHGMPDCLPLLQHAQAPQILQMVNHLAVCGAYLHTIDAATTAAAKVVLALKSYSRQSAQTELVPVNLLENLETALTLYHNRLHQQISLHRSYQPVPVILGVPEELLQVWTNLIQNALYAMPQTGTLTVQVEAIAHQVKVTIADTGVGIPGEIQAHIFEPFFSTKPAGEGNGLGLSIVKRIIDRHQGQISLKSEPGHTQIQVTLPIPMPQSKETS